MKKTLLTLSLMLGLANTTHAEPLTPTPLHAVLGIVTNFILDDGIVHNGTSYGTVTSPYTGRVWLDRNLGAKRVCTSFDDTQCYGDYYQWGRNADGHQKSGSDVTEVISTNDENVGHGDFIIGSGIGDWVSAIGSVSRRRLKWSQSDGFSVCPIGFRVPNITELEAETVAAADITGSTKVTNRDTAFTNFLKLPSTGRRSNTDGIIRDVGFVGEIWASSIEGINSSTEIGFDLTGSSRGFNLRAFGFSVRCVKN